MVNEHNLLKLANYLLKLDDACMYFDMSCYNSHPAFKEYCPASLDEFYGTCGDAIGHGPFAGIPSKPDEPWIIYSARNFISYSLSPEWEWCFSPGWASIDDTPHGAAKRILYMVVKGIPANFLEDDLSFSKYQYPEDFEDIDSHYKIAYGRVYTSKGNLA